MFCGLAMIKKLNSIFARVLADDLLRHVSILFSGMMVVHVCNMVFQMAVSRALPKEEYALLAAFLGVLAIIQRPLGTLGTGVSHYSSLLQQDGRTGDVRRLLRKWLLLTGAVGLFLGVTAVVFNEPLSGFLHLSRVAPVVIAGVLFPVLFCTPVLGGAARGLQLFGWSSASMIFGAVARLGLGAGFVWFLYPACGWAMLGHGFGVYTSAVILFVGLYLVLRGNRKSTEALPSMRVYLLQSFFIQTAYAILMTADVVLMKHYIPEDTEFAYAATLGRMVVFLPGAIVAAMFPKVASSGTMSSAQRTIFIRSFSYTASFVLLAVVGCALFPGLLARILFGITDASVYLKRMIGLMALVMGFSALLNVIIQFLVAQRRFKPAFSIVGFACLYLIGVMGFHANSGQVVAVSAGCNAGALLFGLIAVIRLNAAVLPIDG